MRRTAAPAPVFAIQGFKVTGENPLGDGETARVLAPYLRADATIETLQKATAALEAALRDKGYGLHRVALPPQEVGDTVSLNIVKFSIAKVDIEGRSIYDEGNIRRTPAGAARRAQPQLQAAGHPDRHRQREPQQAGPGGPARSGRAGQDRRHHHGEGSRVPGPSPWD